MVAFRILFCEGYMQHSSILKAESLDRISEYFTGTPPWTTTIQPPDNVAVQLKALNDVRALVREHATAQASGHSTERHQTALVHSLRDALYTMHLVPIRRIALALAVNQPGLGHQFALPSTRTSTGRVLQTARQFVQDVVSYKTVLIANGRPADFVEQLTAATDALQEAILAKATNAGIRSGGTAGIDVALRQGRQVVHSLDAIMHSCFGANADVMAQWRQAKRIRRSTSPMQTGPGGVNASSETPALTPVLHAA